MKKSRKTASKKSAAMFTRRDLLKAIVAGAAAAAVPAARQKAKAEEYTSEAEAWHAYELKLSLHVPRIYDNN